MHKSQRRPIQGIFGSWRTAGSITLSSFAGEVVSWTSTVESIACWCILWCFSSPVWTLCFTWCSDGSAPWWSWIRWHDMVSFHRSQHGVYCLVSLGTFGATATLQVWSQRHAWNHWDPFHSKMFGVQNGEWWINCTCGAMKNTSFKALHPRVC